MSRMPDDIIITDTSPLITLAIVDQLNVLTLPRLRIVIPDAVFVEATRYEQMPGASQLIDFVARHDDLVTVRPTETGQDQITRIREKRSIRGMGETAALEVLETDSINHPDRTKLLLFEDRDVQRKTIILPANAFAIATGDMLRIMEKVKLIDSAANILEQVSAQGRTIDRQFHQLSSKAAIAMATQRIQRGVEENLGK